VGTAPGTQWALTTGVEWLDGTIEEVEGSFWDGFSIGYLDMQTPEASVVLNDFTLRIVWSALLAGDVRVATVALGGADINIKPSAESPEPDDDTPFEFPELPVSVHVDALDFANVHVVMDGEPLPVALNRLQAVLWLTEEGAGSDVAQLAVTLDDVTADMSGALRLKALAAPWPASVNLDIALQDRLPHGLLCVDRYLDTSPKDKKLAHTEPEHQALEFTVATPLCGLHAQLAVQGSLEAATVTLQGQGQDLVLDAVANLAPMAGFPLRDAALNLTLADASALHATVDWTELVAASDAAVTRDQIEGTLKVERLDIGQFARDALPTAVLTTQGTFQVLLRDREVLESAEIALDIDEQSIWNDLPLSGTIQAAVRDVMPDWQQALVEPLAIDVTLGDNHIDVSGHLGLDETVLALDINVPQLEDLWPGLPGGLMAEASLDGNVQSHHLTLESTYLLRDGKATEIGEAPLQLALAMQGGMDLEATQWQGTLDKFAIHHASIGLTTAKALALTVNPQATDEEALWEVGDTRIGIALEDKSILSLHHEQSRGLASGAIQTKGRMPELTITDELAHDIQKALHVETETKTNATAEDRGGVKTSRRWRRRNQGDITLEADWDLALDHGLTGQLNIAHVKGDYTIPGEQPIPLGLREMAVNLTAKKLNSERSQIDAQLNIATRRMGKLNASVQTPLRVDEGGGLSLHPGDPIDAKLNADIDNLAFISIFAGDALEFGGSLHADLSARGSLDGRWDTSGSMEGENLKVIKADDGMRLLDGTLHAGLQGDEFVIESLRFPANIRVDVKEWRTREWLESKESQDGYLEVTGSWSLSEMAGVINTELVRFPVLQRADRFVMLSGDIAIDAGLPNLDITGKITADAGWFDIDMLSEVATVDGDVVVIRKDEDLEDVPVPMEVSMDLEIDLGERFYLTGFGVDSGLVGSLQVVMAEDKLTALGAVRTRGGKVEAYGQSLQLRKGTVTFQGEIGNPVLSIEALRPDAAVQAGVRIGGTAKKPRIDLISYPEVAEVEKLSWLLFGHAPDESEGDMALLISVGSSFLAGDGEPFYRKFGIDELSLKSGDIGSAGSIMPVESVVSGLNAGASDVEQQFIVASKSFSRDLTISIRQALADSGTVGRISYRLAKGLTAEISAGTVNGLGLVYRWFSRE